MNGFLKALMLLLAFGLFIVSMYLWYVVWFLDRVEDFANIVTNENREKVGAWTYIQASIPAVLAAIIAYFALRSGPVESVKYKPTGPLGRSLNT